MKNKLLLLVILGITFFASCSDDDDKYGPKDFNGTYSAASTDHVLDLKYSNAIFTGKSVEFNSVDGKKGTFKLQGVVPGEQEIVIPNVDLTGSNSVYSFSAEDKDADRTVTLTGTVEKGKLSLKVDVKFAQNELMKTWDFSAVKMSWTKPHDYLLTEVDLGFTKMKLTTGLLATMAPTMLSKELKNYLQNVTFREDGNIVAAYNTATATEENPEPEADWQMSPLNLAQYCVKDGVCYVFLSLDMIMRQVDMDQEGRSTDTDPILGAIEQLLTNGIPVQFEKTEGDGKGALYVYLDQVLLKQLGPLLPLVEGLIPGDTAFEATFIGKTISVPVGPILENLPGALEATTEMQVGLQFKGAE